MTNLEYYTLRNKTVTFVFSTGVSPPKSGSSLTESKTSPLNGLDPSWGFNAVRSEIDLSALESDTSPCKSCKYH